MNIGETIQYHRKRLGLSQEDLGQQLNLSRQTISLWENGQTVPTIDNFVRLKEIFGVSVDTLLGCASAPEVEEKPQPVETYRFAFTEEDNKIRYKAWITALVRALCIPFAILVIMFIYTLNGNVTITKGAVVTQHDFKAAAPLFALLLIVYLIAAVRVLKPNIKLFQARLALSQSKIYEYNTFYNFFTLTVKKNDETTSFYKVYYEDLERIEESEHFFSLTAGGICFEIPKRLLPENSFCSFLANSYPAKTKIVKTRDAWSIASLVMIIASALSLPIALLLMVKFAGDTANFNFIEKMWLFFLPLPIPLASVVLGIVLKKKKYYAYKSNITVGCIMAVILCIYGCFTFIFAGVNKQYNAPVLALEEYLDTDIPQYMHIEKQEQPYTDQNGQIHYSVSCYSNVYFDKTQTEEFTKTLVTDTRWLHARPDELEDIINPLFRGTGYDYYLIYNISENEFNTLPGQKGEYQFINAFFSEKSKKLLIVEYIICYK